MSNYHDLFTLLGIGTIVMLSGTGLYWIVVSVAHKITNYFVEDDDDYEDE